MGSNVGSLPPRASVAQQSLNIRPNLEPTRLQLRPIWLQHGATRPKLGPVWKQLRPEFRPTYVQNGDVAGPRRNTQNTRFHWFPNVPGVDDASCGAMFPMARLHSQLGTKLPPTGSNFSRLTKVAAGPSSAQARPHLRPRMAGLGQVRLLLSSLSNSLARDSSRPEATRIDLNNVNDMVHT